MDNFKPFREKIKLIRNYSNLAVSYFKDRSIDFIYVDARHDYCGCYDDLNLYYPKLKCNGILAGHDFQPAPDVPAKNAETDYGMCANGTRILLHGGAVKGKFYFNKSIN